MLLLLLAQLASACPTDANDVSLRAQRALAVEEVADLDNLLADLQCVSGRITPDGAVALHRLAAVAHWQQRDLKRVAAHLRATPTDSWVPTDEELARIAKSSAGSETKKTEALAIPDGWTAMVDGEPSTVRPLDRAVVFQWIDGSSRARRSVMLLPTEALPVAPLGISTPMAAAPKVTPWVGEPENLVLLGGIATGIAAGSLVVAGLNTRGGLPEPTGGGPDPARVESVQQRARRANTLGYLGQGAGVVAIGLVVTSRVAF